MELFNEAEKKLIRKLAQATGRLSSSAIVVLPAPLQYRTCNIRR